jgi:hypothetical protein
MPLSGEDFAEVIEQVQNAIVGIITPVVAPEDGETNAKVFGRYVFDRDDEQWAGLLKSEADGDQVHAWLVSFAGIGGPWPATTAQAAPLLTFTVDFFRRYRLGTDSDNSEQETRAEVAKVWWAFALQPKLGLTTVEQHKLLQMRIKLGPMGAQETHKGFGTLDVQLARLNIR